jgi:hypothetical protein
MIDPRTAAKVLGGEAQGMSVSCPAPGHSRQDRSLSIRFDPNAPEGFVVHSFAGDDDIACRDYVREMLGLPARERSNGAASHDGPRRVVATYDYVDEHGELMFQVVRYEPKTFRQRRKARPGDDLDKIRDGWVWGVKDARRVIYRLPDVLEALASERTIFIAEGEKDVDALWRIGVPATCNVAGAKKWRPEDSAFLKDADVVIVPDGDEPGRDHERLVSASLDGIARRVRVVNLPGSGKDPYDWIAAGGTAEQLLELADNSGETTGAAWIEPDLSLLDDRRGALPEFPTEALTERWRVWVKKAAPGAGVTAGHVMVPLLGVASSLIGMARKVRASRSWSEPFTNWTGVVGASGSGKTPGLNVTTRALSAIERDRKGRIGELQRGHEKRAEVAKAAAKMWKAEVQDAVEAGRPAPNMPENATDPGPFVAPRLYVSDVTIERLATLLTVRPRGMVVIDDELAGLFLNMGRYSNGSDREFWLKAWNGEHHSVERQSRPPVVLDHLLVGMTGGFQPDKLARSFTGDDDGMYARVLFGWPDEPAFSRLPNDVTEVEPEFKLALQRLIDLPDMDGDTFTPRNVPLADEALEGFEQFRQFLHDGKAALDGREREWWSKGATHVLRLAGTLCYLDWAMEGGPEPAAVTAAFMSSAVTLWCGYFWPHSRAALRQVGISDKHANARSALRWIAANDKAEVSREDIRRDALSQRLDAKATGELIDSLVDAGWLRKAEPPDAGRRGRKPQRWSVNPFLKEALRKLRQLRE